MDMGKLLFQGKRHVIGPVEIAFAAGFVIFFFFFGFWFADEVGYARFVGFRLVRTSSYYFALWFMWLWGLGLGAGQLYLTNKAFKTEIYIYENGIKGISVSPKFAINLFDLQSSAFQLNFNQITSVDIPSKSIFRQSRISINSYGKEIHVFLKKPEEAVRIINTKLHQST